MKRYYITGIFGVICMLRCGSVDVEIPEVRLTNPTPGTVVGGNVTIEIAADDNEGIDRIVLYIDDGIETTLFTMPYIYLWDTSGYADSTSHTMYARAFDRAGNQAISETVTVLVNNGC